MRKKKLLQPINIIEPLDNLAECGEMFDLLTDIIEDDMNYEYNVEMIGITLKDGWVMPIVVILN